MKKILAILLFFNTGYSVTIKNINFIGDAVTKKVTLLSFFPEYYEKKDLSDEELKKIIKNWKRRLERTGWFRNIKIDVINLENNEVDINLSFTEKIPYTVYFKNNYIGIGKYNIWGEGKELYFEAGLSHKSIKIIDRIFNGTSYFYEFYAGSELFTLHEYLNGEIEKKDLSRQKLDAKIGNNILPDQKISFKISLEWFQDTNDNENSKNINYSTISWSYDTTEGYPVVKNGLKWENNLKFYTDFKFLVETDFKGYFMIFETLILGSRLHIAFSYPELPIYHKFNLQGINGLRTLSIMPGLIGSNIWETHIELRWAFWDVVPFLLYDLQLEALGFVDIGEAKDKIEEFGKPHIVYGCGIRIYLDTFAIRTEIGVDESSKVSVMSSFELPF
ncbi:MAG: hypothetical protein N2258_05805 [Brevinematales bacterium]|nr:hypothetical protein [Brevinematales bacterium]